MPLTILDRLQRRFGWLAIPNLTLILIAGQAALFVADRLLHAVSLDRIALEPAKVLHGEVWRLATFMFMPPQQDVIFVVFYFALFHLFGTTLEREWGAFKYNAFLLVGYLANVAAAFAGAALVNQQLKQLGPLAEHLPALTASNGFLYSSLFLAFARLYPDFTLNLFFILPIRIKWLALLQWLTFAYLLVRSDWMTRMLIVATVLNYLVFFGPEHLREWRYGHRRRTFHGKAAKAAIARTTHECVVCGLSSEESPRTLFRYCSKCVGQRCYCPEHIRDHEHVIAEEATSP